MPKIALYVSAVMFALVAVIFGFLVAFEVEVLVGNTLYRSVTLLGAAVFSAVLAVWMLIASRDL